MTCTGTEARLLDCNTNSFGDTGNPGASIVAIRCTNSECEAALSAAPACTLGINVGFRVAPRILASTCGGHANRACPRSLGNQPTAVRFNVTHAHVTRAPPSVLTSKGRAESPQPQTGDIVTPPSALPCNRHFACRPSHLVASIPLHFYRSPCSHRHLVWGLQHMGPAPAQPRGSGAARDGAVGCSD